MILGDQKFPVAPGDTVCIPSGPTHAIHNPDSDMLLILCCCAPAYWHDDTELV